MLSIEHIYSGKISIQVLYCAVLKVFIWKNLVMNSVNIFIFVSIFIVAVNAGSLSVHESKNGKDKVELIFVCNVNSYITRHLIKENKVKQKIIKMWAIPLKKPNHNMSSQTRQYLQAFCDFYLCK